MLAESWPQLFRTGADRLSNIDISESWGGVHCKLKKTISARINILPVRALCQVYYEKNSFGQVVRIEVAYQY